MNDFSSLIKLMGFYKIPLSHMKSTCGHQEIVGMRKLKREMKTSPREIQTYRQDCSLLGWSRCMGFLGLRERLTCTLRPLYACCSIKPTVFALHLYLHLATPSQSQQGVCIVLTHDAFSSYAYRIIKYS